jgi:hypothetical protein
VTDLITITSYSSKLLLSFMMGCEYFGMLQDYHVPISPSPAIAPMSLIYPPSAACGPPHWHYIKIHKRQVQPDKCYRISTAYTHGNTIKGPFTSFYLSYSNKMRSTLAAAVLASGLLGSVSAHDHHDDIVNPQEPFVGWTQEDLDAKWGTDVCSTIPINGFCD